MVKMTLSLVLTWMFLSTAAALVCQTCTDTQCLNTAPATCSSETMCITATIQATSSGTTGQQIYKACASSSLCPATSSQTFSTNLGVAGAVASAQCCNTDNCNSATLPSPASQSNNSLQCFSCDPFTSQCTTPLQCRGEENSCFKASVMRGARVIWAFGCTSANLCSAASTLVSSPFWQSFGHFTSGPMCCGTTLCNKPTVKRRVARQATATTSTTATASTTATTSATTSTITSTTTTTPATTSTITSTTTTTPATTTSTTATTSAATSTTATASAPTATATASHSTTGDACYIRLSMIHLLPGLFIFTLY